MASEAQEEQDVQDIFWKIGRFSQITLVTQTASAALAFIMTTVHRGCSW